MALATVRKWCSENDKNLIKLQTMIGGVRADVRMWDTLGLFYILFSFSQNKIFDEIQHFYVMPCGCIRVLKYFKTWTLLLLLWLRLSHAMAYFLQEQDILRKCNEMKIYLFLVNNCNCFQPWHASPRRSYFSNRNWLPYQFRSRQVNILMIPLIQHLNLAENARLRRKHKKRFKH